MKRKYIGDILLVISLSISYIPEHLIALQLTSLGIQAPEWMPIVIMVLVTGAIGAILVLRRANQEGASIKTPSEQFRAVTADVLWLLAIVIIGFLGYYEFNFQGVQWTAMGLIAFAKSYDYSNTLDATWHCII